MSQDEVGTMRTLTAYKEAMSTVIQQYRGRVVDAPGDNLLAEFGSVVDAVNCAVEVQRELGERNEELAYSRRMEFRIGVNLGDVLEEEGRIYGDGVNIAARIESLTEGGGICISGTVYDQVKHKLGLEYEFLGEQEFKNIPEPVRVYRVLSYPGAAAYRVIKTKKAIGKTWRNVIVAAVAVLVLGTAAMALWYFVFRPTAPQVESGSADKMASQLPEKPSIQVPRLLHGAWVNPDYNTTANFAKIFFNRYGTCSGYKIDSDPDPAVYGKFAITDNWTDPEGNIWLKERNHVQIMGVTRYRLMKLSTTGKTLEIILSYDNYPTELDPNNKYYGIYQRQQ